MPRSWWGCSSMTECLASMCKALGLKPSTEKNKRIARLWMKSLGNYRWITAFQHNAFNISKIHPFWILLPFPLSNQSSSFTSFSSLFYFLSFFPTKVPVFSLLFLLDFAIEWTEEGHKDNCPEGSVFSRYTHQLIHKSTSFSHSSNPFSTHKVNLMCFYLFSFQRTMDT